MKKLGRIFLSLCALFLLSGCMKYNVSMGIDKDKHMDLQVIVALDEETIKEMMKSMGNDDYDEDSLSSMFDMSEGKDIFRKRGYEVEDYSEGNYNGIIANLKIDNIDNVSVDEDLQVVLSDLLNEEFDDSKFFKIEKKSDKNIYTAHFIYEADDSDDFDTTDNVPGLEVKYTVKLPYKVISDNADSKRNNELTWNISMDKQTDIKYSFEIPNEDDEEVASTEDDNENIFIGFISNNTMIIGLAALLLVVIIIIVIIIVVSKNKKKKNNKESSVIQSIPSQAPVIDETIIDDGVSINEDVANDNSSIVSDKSVNEAVISDEKSEILDTIDSDNSEISNTESLTDESIQNDSNNNNIEDSINDEEAIINSEPEVQQHQENHNEARVCKTCGADVQDDQKFCMNCGSKLD